MMSERIYLNNDWKFAEQFEASMTEAAYDDSTMQNVRLPHTCKEKMCIRDRVLLARDIAKQIESELEYPGQIKVNVIRESRVTDFAK